MALASWNNQQIIGQLDSGFHWTGLTITYRFPVTTTGVYSAFGDELPGFRAVGATTAAQVRVALQTWDDLIPQTMQETSSTTSDIEVEASSTGVSYAHAYQPTAGSVWFGASYTSGINNLVAAQPGSYGFETYIHELGHSIGLNHMGDYNGSGAWTPSSYQDSQVYSVMSYFGPNGPNRSTEVAAADWTNAQGQDYYPQTPMLNDIMAIQSMYGVSTSTRTGDTVYGFNTNIAGQLAAIYDFTLNLNPILTLFDSGGTDTLDLSGWSAPSTITLVPGGYSSANSMTNNIAIAYTAVIENAVGGSGDDYIGGNSVANVLQGGAGNDTLLGLDGNDTLTGGAGSDSIDGGTGTDTAVFPGSYASYTISLNAATGAYQVADGTGTDSVSNVEFFQFSDQTRASTQLVSSDTNPPTLIVSTPADNAINFSASGNIVLTFSESVQPGTGSIQIFNGNGSVARTIAVTDTSQVTFSGSGVTINPTADLVPGASYYIVIPSTAIKDLAGNAFAGISNPTTLNFTTSAAVDTTPPTLTFTAPADNAADVAVSSNFSLTFSEAVQAGSGNIEIHNGGSGTIARTIAVTDISQVSFQGSTVVVNPTADLAFGSSYYITMAAGVIKDTSGNSFAGISSATAYNFTTVASAAVDDYPGSPATSGVVVVDGTASTGVINPADDRDWFKVILSAGVSYTFDLTSTGLGDPFLTLFDPSGVHITENDDGGGGHNSQITYTPSTSGTYYLEASSWNLQSTGAYTLSARSNDDYPWSVLTSGVVTVGGPAVAGTINFVDDLDLLKVSLVAGQSYIFELDSNGLPDPYLQLYDPLLNLAAEDDDSGGQLNSRIDFVAPTTGTYYLGAFDVGPGTGAYTIHAVQVQDDYPWSTSTSGVVTVGGAATAGVINFAGDDDLLKVVLVAGTTYAFELTRTGPSSLDPYLRLYDPAANFIAFDDDSAGAMNSRLVFTAPASGTYYLGASDYADATGAYTLGASVVDVTPPLLQSTNPLDNANGVAVGTNFTLTFNENVRAGSGSIVIHNGNGTVARSIAASDTSQATFSGSTLTLNPSTDLGYGSSYYITVDSGAVLDTSGNAYAGLASTTAFNFTTEAAPADDYPMSTATTGVLVVDAAALFGTINSAYDGDMFKVALTAGTTYRFDLTRTINGLVDPYLQLFTPGLELAATDDDGGTNGNSRLDYTATTSGTYYLAAWDFGAGTGGYQIAAHALVDDHPWIPGLAPTVSIGGGAATGTIEYAGDGDLFRVTLNSGVTYQFDLTHSAGGLTDPFLYLLDGNLAPIAQDDDSGGNLDARILFAPSTSGVYYLGAFDQSSGIGEYHLSAAVAGLTEPSNGNDSITGTAGVDTIHALLGNDTMRGNQGNDILDGGGGIDTAVYAGPRAQYTVANGAATVTDLSGLEGTDTLTSVERLQFSDTKVAFDLAGNAGIVAKTIGAVFGAPVVAIPQYVGIGLQLVDGGMSYADLMQLAINVLPAHSNTDVVNTIYHNLVGVYPDPASLALFKGWLDDGIYTQGQLGVLAADTVFNTNNIDLAGLALHGVAYV